MLAVLAVCCIVGVGMLMAVMFVPDDLIEERVDQLPRDAWVKPGVDSLGICFLLTVGLAEPGVSVFERAMTRMKPRSCSYVTAWGWKPPIVNPKHWFGIAVLSRPLYAWFGFSAVAGVSAALLSAAVTSLALAVGHRRGWAAGLAIVAPLVLTGDFFADGLFTGWNHGLMMAAGLAGVAVIAVKSDSRAEVLSVWAFGAGCVFNYFNMFSFVPGMWALTAAAAGVCAPSQRTLKAVGVAAAWPAGFALMWMCKWLVSALILGPGEMAAMIAGRLKIRSVGGLDSYRNVDVGVSAFGEGLVNVWESWFTHERLAIPVLCTLGLLLFIRLGLLFVRRRALRGTRLGVESLVGPAVAVVCCLGANAHLTIHAEIYDYRIAPMLIGAVAVHVVAAMTPRSLHSHASDATDISENSNAEDSGH